ncbi:MAG: protein kinase, partial [Acidobacteriia bacterium]|nr:protein kinase [Terriglobia bacterium]
ARDTRLNRSVAIKISNAQFSERFEREARAIAALNHPHICTLYDVGPDYLVMELVEGPTLADRIGSGRIPIEEALAIARQIAEALEAAHEKGIVHRDLKPANVKVTPEGVVKVLDFGLAKSAEESTTAAAGATNSPTLTISPTRAGMILGTAAYMSPEQVRGVPVDRRSDIWAFGVVLYEMLSGKRLFAGESVSDILAAVLRGEPDWSSLPADTPPRIRKLLRRCLERDRKQRLQAIGEARIAIDAPEDAAPEEQAAAPHKPRPVWPWATAFAAALCLAALAWWQATRPPPLRPLIRLTAELAPGVALDSQSLLALSSDGTRLAFSMRSEEGKKMLAIRNLGDNQVTHLPGTENGDSPFFSPDEQWLGFFAGGELKKISLNGGAVATVRAFPSLRGASWGDGYIVAPMGVATGLFRIPIAGGMPVSITEVNREKGELAHRWPQILPGGDLVLFTVYHLTTKYDDSDIEVVSQKTGQRKIIYQGGFFGRYLPSGHLVYVHQNTLFGVTFDLRHSKLSGEPQPLIQDIGTQSDVGANFSFSDAGTSVYVGQEPSQRSIYWLDSAGRTQPLQAAPGLYGSPRFSPDGTRLAFTLEDSQGRQDIWVRDLQRNTTRRLTSTAANIRTQVWTPDAKNLIFDSWNQDAPGVYVIRSDGSGEPRLLAKGNAVPSSISPDGKWLATYGVGRGNAVTISKVPIEGDSDHLRLGPAQPFIETPFLTVTPAFSPDGRWLTYTSTEPGKEGVWVRPSSGQGGGWQIGSRFGFPLWSRNGKELFFLEDRQRLMVVDYTARGDSFVAGSPRPWSDKRVPNLGSPPVYAYDAAPDGKRLAVVLYPDGAADAKPVTHVTFLLNFYDYLRQHIPLEGK